MESKEKFKVWVYFTTYGSHKHDVLCIQVGGEAGETFREHVMLDPHQSDFGVTFYKSIHRFLSEDYNVIFVDDPRKG